jgi:hypothetical protein
MKDAGEGKSRSISRQRLKSTAVVLAPHSIAEGLITAGCGIGMPSRISRCCGIGYPMRPLSDAPWGRPLRPDGGGRLKSVSGIDFLKVPYQSFVTGKSGAVIKLRRLG